MTYTDQWGDTQKSELLLHLELRFQKNMHRHPEESWDTVSRKLLENPDKMRVIYFMEQTGGEPDVVKFDESADIITFFDCSAESPTGRRSLCYDRAALDARKEFKPENSALDMAAQMGIKILDEEDYRFLQTKGNFDTKTSSWIQTPEKIRKLGGALFGDRRYDHVFIYHNGAQSYYAARGFRGKIVF
jgi:hypothetical protein